MANPDLSPELRSQLIDQPGKVLAEIFIEHQPRLVRLIDLRLDRRLYGRVGVDDVLQEAFLSATQRVRHFLDSTNCSLYIWIRGIVLQTMIDLHRHHLGTQKRDANRQTNLLSETMDSSGSRSLLASLSGSVTSPSRALRNEELLGKLEHLLSQLNPDDREVLTMRHFEDLTNNEVAEILHLSPAGASLRYTRALERLQELIATCPELLDGPEP
jgi:RNA polymerase sigma-70 factor (ECF subfamily)